jgi:hypothetical protein
MSILNDYRSVRNYTIETLKKAILDLENSAKTDTICPELLQSRAEELKRNLSNIENDIY